jgi:hypothetical protein
MVDIDNAIRLIKEDEFQKNNPKKKLKKLLFNKKNKIKEEISKIIKKDSANIKDEICKEFDNIDKNLLEIQNHDHKVISFANYDNNLKIYSKKRLLISFKIYDGILPKSHHDINKEINDQDILKMWKNCFNSKLFPNIIKETKNFIAVEYVNINFKTLDYIRKNKGIYCVLKIIKKNKNKILDYHNLIKNQLLCINDFNFKNFVVNEDNDLIMIDGGDLDYIKYSLPEIFIFDKKNKINVVIFKCISIKDKKFYEDLLYKYYSKDEIGSITYL